MAGWDARASEEVDSRRRLEAEARYALARPLIDASAAWIDLGCGDGTAAAAAGIGPHEGLRAWLVDASAGAPAEARGALGMSAATALVADLESDDGIAAVRDPLAGLPDGPRVATCFDVLPQLADFSPLVGVLAELVREHSFSVLLSAPDHDFVELDDPYRRTTWGEGATEELLRVLPEPHRVMRQVPLGGSAFVPWRAEASATAAPLEIDAERRGGDLIVALGPRAADLLPVAFPRAIDLDLDRGAELRRRSELALLRAWAGEES